MIDQEIRDLIKECILEISTPENVSGKASYIDNIFKSLINYHGWDENSLTKTGKQTGYITKILPNIRKKATILITGTTESDSVIRFDYVIEDIGRKWFIIDNYIDYTIEKTATILNSKIMNMSIGVK